MKIYCTGCELEVEARLTDGREIYPHRPDLFKLPFWKCDTCNNFVGCHHKTKQRTKPLGVIPTKEIKNARKHIHALLDPIWKTGKMRRGKIYAKISKALGYTYHTGEIKSVEEAREIYRIILELNHNNTRPMPIPLKLRSKIAEDPFMTKCIYRSPGAPNNDCGGRITWEHAWIYAGKQIQERWAIVPCCQNHNSGKAMVKSYNRYRALIRADIEELKKRYPKTNWDQELKYLTSLYLSNIPFKGI